MLRGGSSTLYIVIQSSDYNPTWTIIDTGSNIWRNTPIEAYVLSF